MDCLFLDCIGRFDHFCEPSGWTAGQPNVYFPFENSDNYTLKTGQNTVQPNPESVLISGIVSKLPLQITTSKKYR